MQLRDFMQSPVCACSRTTTLASAGREMAAHNVGSLVVTDDAEHIVGIVTDRDIAIGLGRGFDALSEVDRIMSRNRVVTIPEDASLDDAAATMASNGVRRLPVTDDHDRPLGMISLDDLLNYLTQETITLVGAIRAQGPPRG